MNDDRERITLRVSPDMMENVRYWARKKGLTINDYIIESITLMIGYENRDYPLSTLEQARLNQLLDVVSGLDRSIGNLEQVVVSGFDSLQRMAHGDSDEYLSDVDGEL